LLLGELGATRGWLGERLERLDLSSPFLPLARDRRGEEGGIG
jgi:hypothetical protein